MSKWALLFAFSFLAACSDDTKKRVGSCADDTDCSGGICYAEQCYDACTEQADCAGDEFCVFKTDASSAICVVAAEHAGCVTAADCADLVAGDCQKSLCDEETALCAVVEAIGLCTYSPEPVFGAWRAMPLEGAPSARNYVGGGWNGTRMCLWGGYDGSSLGDGACYVAADDAWAALPTTNAPSARCLMPEAWAGARFCTWAGFGAGASGACWTPGADAWEPMAEAGAPATPRQNHGAAWTGSELCFFGGRSAAGGTDLPDGGCYDPVARSWRLLPTEGGPTGATNPSVLWIKDRLCVWGGWNASGFQANGACWTPGAATWESIAAPPAGVVAPFVDARAAGDQLCVWGGGAADGSALVATGACYHPATAAWHVLPTEDAPTARTTAYVSAWTGDWWCVYGGTLADEAPASGGACYSPALDRWFPMPSAGAVPIGGEATSFWTGTELCAWGGRLNGQNQQAGACLAINPAP